MIHKIIYYLGTYFRNKEIFSSLRLLKESEHWERDRLIEYQEKQFKELIEKAYNESPYYKKKFDRLGINTSDFKSIKDLNKFPMLSKEELKLNIKDIQIKSNLGKMFYSETSGSTGTPLVFYRNSEWDARHRAAMYRGYSWHGINPWDKNGYFWGYNINNKNKFKVRFLDLLQNRFRVFSYKDNELERFIEKLENAKYLEGYSSMIYQVAKIINDKNYRNYKFNKLKMIKGTSEKIFENYQNETMQAFGLNIISEYGAAEAGIIAFECPKGNMHITMENVIVEEEDNQIIVTNLVSKSLPIIRYKLGDYIELDSETICECGVKHPIIKSVLGRVGSVIYGNENIYPSLTLYYVFKNLAKNNIILNYQAIQNKKGELEIRFENILNEKEKIELKKEIKKYFGSDIECTIIDDTKFIRGTGKLKDFISNL